MVDEALAERLARGLGKAGHDAVHVTDRGLLGAPDHEVMARAAAENRVLVSADTDFGELLALGHHPGPSVIIFRRSSDLAEEQLRLLLANLGEIEDSLTAGAVVVVTAGGLRIRLLPIE